MVTPTEFLSQQNKGGNWFRNLTPKKKWVALSAAGLAVAGAAAAAYLLIVAAGNPTLVLKETSSTDQRKAGGEIKIEISLENLKAGTTDITVNFKYSDGIFSNEEVAGQDLSVSVESGGFELGEIDTENNKIILKSKASFSSQSDKMRMATVTIKPKKAGLFTLTSQNGIYKELMENGNLGARALANKEIKILVTAAPVDNMIYFDTTNMPSEPLGFGDQQTIDLKLKTTKDVVAVAANIKYDPNKIKIVEVKQIDPFTNKFDEAVAPETKDGGMISLMRGVYGNGKENDGITNPSITNSKGFKGETILAQIVITPGDQAGQEPSNLEIESAEAVVDDGKATLLTISLGGSYPVSLNGLMALAISQVEYVCDGNNLIVSWQTSQKTQTNQATAVFKENNQDKSRTAMADSLKGSTAHRVELNGINAKTGQLEILSEQENGEQIAASRQFNCALGESTKLRITGLQVVPNGNQATVEFSTTGGTKEGAAKSKVVGVKSLKNNIPGMPISCDGCSGVDWTTTETNLHKFTLNILDAGDFQITVAAMDGEETVQAIKNFTMRLETAKNTNVVLAVERDRTCDSWLYCRTSAQVTNSKGRAENLCFDIGLCQQLDANGNCSSPIDLAVSKFNQTFMAPQVAENAEEAENEFKNLSGLSKIGLDWQGGKKIEGLKHYATLVTMGGNVSLSNGNMELGDTWPWQANDTGAGVGVIGITQDIYNVGNNQQVNNVLKVGVDTTKYNATNHNSYYAGAGIELGRLNASEDYLLSFMARSAGADKNLRLQFKTPRGENDFSYTDVSKNLIKISREPKTYTLKLGTIPTDNRKVSLVFNQTGSDNSDKKEFLKDFYLDNVSLQPVLHVQNKTAELTNDKYVARSCRLYPNAAAADCDYYDSTGRLYRGWRGFCVEPDPANPNLCLNWWPVDIIPGETDVFGSDQQVGYKDRMPLYYCLEAKGNMPYYEKDKVFHDGFCTGKGKHSPFYTSSSSGNFSEFSEIINFDKGWNNFNLGAFIELGGYQSNPGMAGFFDEVTFLKRIKEYNITYINKYSDKTNLKNIRVRFWYARDDDSCTLRGIENIVDLNPGNDFTKNFSIVLNNEKNEKIDYVFKLDTETGLFKIKAAATGGGEGTIIKILMDFSFAEPCMRLVQVVDPTGENYAFADRIMAGGWKSENNLGYQYKQDYAPYGAAVPPAENTNEPNKWTEPLYVMPPDTTYSQAPYQTRAGWPYSFAKITDAANYKATCILGSAENLGQKCESSYDCGYSLEGGTGLCVGVNLTEAQLEKMNNSIADQYVRGLNRGKQNLSKLFAKSIKVWTWDGTKYLNTPSIDSSYGWNILETGEAPQVTNITINGSGGNMTFSKVAGVVLRFNTNLNESQLPLKAYRVAWGDGTVTEINNLSIAGRPSADKPFVLTHTYICNKSTGCDFTPQVQVEDNWGWCTGGVVGNLCPEERSDRWAEFGGTIRVEP